MEDNKEQVPANTEVSAGKQVQGEVSAFAKTSADKKYTSKDFSSDQDVRWCPGLKKNL